MHAHAHTHTHTQTHTHTHKHTHTQTDTNANNRHKCTNRQFSWAMRWGPQMTERLQISQISCQSSRRATIPCHKITNWYHLLQSLVKSSNISCHIKQLNHNHISFDLQNGFNHSRSRLIKFNILNQV